MPGCKNAWMQECLNVGSMKQPQSFGVIPGALFAREGDPLLQMWIPFPAQRPPGMTPNGTLCALAFGIVW